MSPDTLFQMANLLALTAWGALALGPLAPRITDLYAGLLVPAVLSIGYTSLMLAHWSTAPGGFDSLASVMTLFTLPQDALAGWVHYLAFDLVLGAWAARQGRAHRIPHLLILPCLVLTFLFGPAGFLLSLCLLATARATSTERNAS
jgi:hypothetical protein